MGDVVAGSGKQRRMGRDVCSLLIYQLKDRRAREKKYQATIRQLGDGLQAVRELDEKIENIHKDMRSRLDEGFRLDRVRQGEQS